MTATATIESLRRAAQPLSHDEHYSYLLGCIGDASLVLLGEATHGSREFYRLRTEITKRLIVEQGFDAVAVEADWPDALRVSRYVQHGPTADTSAAAALSGFERFPQWMWRNTEIVALVEWLRAHNTHVPQAEQRVGFYGLDLYSLQASMHAVIAYLDKADPAAARRARERYACMNHGSGDPQHYGYAAAFGLRPDCEDEVVRQLREMNAEAALYAGSPGGAVPDELFYAQQNARVAKNAETYYRAMFQRGDASWNIRDTHMAETLHALRQHLGRRSGRRPARIVVWAHNSHLGDARATEMGEGGQLNLGQLVRQNYLPGEAYLIGFTTHTGFVTAASEWDGPAELKPVVPSRIDSIERVMHAVSVGMDGARFLLPITGNDEVQALLPRNKLERAIGVIYRPDTERVSHYFHADVARQFDALIHVDRTTAVQPLERSALWHDEEMPETYPSGL
jgi:erythromycin esterase-like protein